MDLKLTEELVANLKAGYLEGKNVLQLAEQFNISPATVSRGLHKAGLEPERKDGLWLAKPSDSTKVKRLLSAEEQTQLCDEFIYGPLKRQELAKKYNVHPDTVNAILRRNGISVKKYVPEEVVNAFCEEYKNGTTLYDIAKIYDLSLAVVKHWLTERGLIDITKEAAQKPTEAEKILSTAEFRKRLRALDPLAIQRLEELLDDPHSQPSHLLTAIQLLWERNHGKPKEAVEEEEGSKTTADKILGLVNKDGLFGKK